MDGVAYASFTIILVSGAIACGDFVIVCSKGCVEGVVEGQVEICRFDVIILCIFRNHAICCF